ncbi:acid phosphatase/vanadium-dependent haloperoxidase protein-related protein [Tanacetum coccineum]
MNGIADDAAILDRIETLVYASQVETPPTSRKRIQGRYKEHRWDLEQLIGSGGMPPSHSAIVIALAVAVGLHDGLDSSTFATALILACIAMYDATGVRLHVGHQAEVLNQIVFKLPAQHSLAESRSLRKLLGHTPPHV